MASAEIHDRVRVRLARLCGDGLEVRIGGHWLPVRIEYHDRHHWVLHADGDAVRVLPSRRLPARPDPRDHRW